MPFDPVNANTCGVNNLASSDCDFGTDPVTGNENDFRGHSVNSENGQL